MKVRGESSGRVASTGRWFAAQVQPGREALALCHLKRQGFETFCAMSRSPRRTPKRTVTALKPFFPGYIFVHLDLERQRWRSINGTIGVLRLVSFSASGAPCPFPPGFVEQLRQMSGSDGELCFGEALAAGARVRISSGPFDGVYGILESSGQAQRVTILIELLSKQTRVHLRRDVLLAA